MGEVSRGFVFAAIRKGHDKMPKDGYAACLLRKTEDFTT